jgi:hypothetical protein
MKGVKMLSRKHYISIAKIIKDNSVIEIGDVSKEGKPIATKQYINRDSFINDLTMYFKSDNNSFSWERFVNACDDV